MRFISIFFVVACCLDVSAQGMVEVPRVAVSAYSTEEYESHRLQHPEAMPNLTDTLILDEARRFSGDFAQVVHEGKHKQLHRSGLLVDDSGEQHQNGNSIVRKEKRYGVINREGKLIVPFSYDDIRFDGSHIRLRTEDKDGLVDSIGNLVIPVEHDEVTPLTEQVVRVRKGHLWALMDIPTRKRLTDYVYTNIIYDPNPEHLISVEISDKWGLVDEQGTVRIKADYARIFPQSFPSNDVIWYCQTEGLGMSIVDSNGKILTDGYYEHIRPAGPDKWTAIGERGRTFSLLDLKSREVKASHTGNLYSFIDSLAVVDQDGKSGVIGLNGMFIDSLGKEYRFNGYDYVGSFTHGAALVVDEGKAGFIALDGKEIIPLFLKIEKEKLVEAGTDAYTTGMVFEYMLTRMVNDDPLVVLGNIDGTKSLFSFKSDKVTRLFTYNQITHASYDHRDRYYTVRSEGHMGLHRADGELIYPADYDGIRVFVHEHSVELQKDGKYGLGSIDGTITLPVIYEAIERNSGSALQPFFPVAVSENGKWSFINEQGEKLPVIVKEFGR